MTEGIASIIAQLERQKTAIDRALAALREIEDIAAPGTAAPTSTVTPEVSTLKGTKRSAAVRKRMQEAQRARWARIRGESEPPAPVTEEAAKAKRQISAEGIKRIVAATKRRWARVRAEAKAALEHAGAKKATRKKTAAVPKKAMKKAAKTTTPVKPVAKRSAAGKNATAPAPAAKVGTST